MDISRHKILKYENYQAEDFEVWKILYDRQMENLPGKATEEFFNGLKKINFSADKIPVFEEVNSVLENMTGWKIHIVPGLIPEKDFFELMQGQNFCASTWLRSKKELDYLEEPDMFHDVFGHVPLLTNKPFCKFLEELCRIAHKHIDNALVVEAVSRIYWYTVEFGLIRENGELRIYGAGILSSKGESNYCLGLEEEKPKYTNYDVATLIDTAYIKHKYQETYFVIDSYEQLYNSIPEVEEYAEKMYRKSQEAQKMYEAFTEKEHQIWANIYEKHLNRIEGKVANDYWIGLKALEFSANKIPNYDDVNQILLKHTYWRINSLDNPRDLQTFYNFKKNRNFFPDIHSSKFNPNGLANLDLAQSFQNVLSGVPLLIQASAREGVVFEANKYYCQFLEELYRVFLNYLNNEEAMLYIARIYWYTVKFGLIQEKDGVKMYGSDIMSASAEEIGHALNNPDVKRLSYDVNSMMSTPFREKFQDTFFVIQSYEQLYDSIPVIEQQLVKVLNLEVV